MVKVDLSGVEPLNGRCGSSLHSIHDSSDDLAMLALAAQDIRTIPIMRSRYVVVLAVH